MLTVGELAQFLRTSAARAKAELAEVTGEYVAELAKDAKALIGQEREEWPPLKPATVAEKQRLGFTGQVSSTDPLLRTGDMRDSIRPASEATATGAEGVVGSSSKVALWQEMGTVGGSDGAGRVPPRPFLAGAMAQGQKKAEEHFGALGVHLLNPPLR